MFFSLIFFDRVLPFAPVIIQVLPALDLREVHAVLDAGAVVEAQQLLTTHILPHGHWPGLQFTTYIISLKTSTHHTNSFFNSSGFID